MTILCGFTKLFHIKSIFLVSPYLSIFFRVPELSRILKVFSIVLIINSFGSVQRAILTKDMKFKKLSLINIISLALQISVSFTLAFSGFGVWSIIFGLVVFSLTQNILYWFLNTWRPTIKFDKQSFRDLFSFGAGILGTSLVGQLSSNIDVVIIGRMLGTSVLGLYNFSLRITSIISSQINAMTASVLFPAYSEIQKNTEKIKSSYILITKQVSIVSMPMMLGLIIVSPEFVKVVLSDKWLEAIPIIRLLAVNGLMNAIGGGLWGSVLKAQGYSGKVFFLTVIRVFALGIFVIIGSFNGVIGIAAAVAIYGIIFRFVYQHIVNRIINLSMMDYLKAIYPSSICTSGMVIILMLAKFLAYRTNIISLHFLLIGIIILGICVYFVLLRLIYRSELNNMLNIIKLAK